MIRFSVLQQVEEQVLLVGQLMVVLKMVHNLLVVIVFDQAVIPVPPMGLLPFELHKHRLGLLGFDPALSLLHNPPHQVHVVARPKVVLEWWKVVRSELGSKANIKN